MCVDGRVDYPRHYSQFWTTDQKGLRDEAIRFSITCLPFLIPLGVGIYFMVKALRKRSANRPNEHKNRDMASATAVEIPPVELEEKK